MPSKPRNRESLFRRILTCLVHPLACLRDVWTGLKWFARAVSPCRFSILFVLGGAAFLLWADTGRDVLRGLAERQAGGATAWLAVWFFFAALVWTYGAWYWSRVMLYLKFDDAPELRRTKALRTVQAYTPRMIGLIAAMTIPAALLKASLEYPPGADTRRVLLWFASGALVGAGVFLWIAIKRRDWVRRAGAWLQARSGPAAGIRHRLASQFTETGDAKQERYGQLTLRELPGLAKTTLLLTAAGELALLAVFVTGPEYLAPHVGSAAIVLLAASGWIVLGSFSLYAGKRLLRIPILTLLLLLAILFSFVNDNHAVRTLDTADAFQDRRPDLRQALAAWLDHVEAQNPGAKTHPLFVVAADGGGIRAAYWTATVLGHLQDQNPRFADHLFAVSGVSGGSLGAAVFTTLVAEARRENAGEGRFVCDLGSRRDKPKERFRLCAQAILAQDFLSPVVAGILYPDLVQRIWPDGIAHLDRARALERSWELAWTQTLKNLRFGSAFDDLWEHSPGWVPALYLNSTSVETGRRVIVSSVRLNGGNDRPAFHDAEDGVVWIGQSLPLSAAVHLSARFTYVSPAASIYTKDDSTGDERLKGHLVDGGYFENSGATTAYELLDEINRINQSCELDAHRRAVLQRVKPFVILISNDQRGAWIYDGKVPDDPLRVLPEVRSPVEALINARSARGTWAQTHLRAVMDNDVHRGSSVHFALCPGEVEIPLGWTLSDLTEQEMDDQLTFACGSIDNLRAEIGVLELLGQRYGTSRSR